MNKHFCCNRLISTAHIQLALGKNSRGCVRETQPFQPFRQTFNLRRLKLRSTFKWGEPIHTCVWKMQTKIIACTFEWREERERKWCNEVMSRWGLQLYLINSRWKNKQHLRFTSMKFLANEFNIDRYLQSIHFDGFFRSANKWSDLSLFWKRISPEWSQGIIEPVLVKPLYTAPRFKRTFTLIDSNVKCSN